jgi:uncharacterized SAM-binding protein YcdF (DUF218 family)
VYQSVTGLLQPYTLLCLLAALAIANLWRKRRETRLRLIPLTVLFAVLVVHSTPAVGTLALRSLEGRFAVIEKRPEDAEAIVVLGGGINLPDVTGGPAELDTDSLQRCLHALDLYRRGTPCPVLVSGGKVDALDAGPAVADVMRDFLLGKGVPAEDLIVEGASRTTHENAVESCKLLGQRGIRKVVLVTDAVHEYRAVACFRKERVEVVAAPCRFQADRLDRGLRDVLPDPDAAEATRDSAHEWLGVLWYWLRGWV